MGSWERAASIFRGEGSIGEAAFAGLLKSNMDYRYLDRLAGRPRPNPNEHPRCVVCGYDLHGSVSDRCPECGNPIDDEETQRLAEELRYKLAELDSSLQSTPVAWKLVVVGACLQIIRSFLLLGWLTSAMARVAILFCGIKAFLLVWRVFRLRSIPLWARGRLNFRPNVILCCIGLVGGLLLIAAAIAL